MNLMKNEKEFIEEENKLRMKSDAKLLAYLIYLNYEHSNGKSINIKGPISKSGNKYLRKILFVSILNILSLTRLCHTENDIENYYRKKRNEGKHHYVATIACTTKLLRKIFVLCKQLDK